MFGHALLRSVILVVLAVFLASNGSRYTNYTFVNVLGQIGLGYTFVFLLLGRSPAVQLAAAVAILVADWLLFATYPLPDSDFPFANYGAGEPGIAMSGFFAHWNKNANVAAAFDRWFLNLFPHPPGHPFVFNEGGYATLNFIPSMATMIFGVLAGERLRSCREPMAKLRTLLVAGAVCLAIGAAPGRDGLPDRQADLDPLLDRLLDRLDPRDARGVLRRDRRGRVSSMVVSPDRRRHELDRHLPDGAAHEAVRGVDAPHPFRPGPLRRALWPARPGVLDAARILADLFLDVPAEDLRQDLREGSRRLGHESSGITPLRIPYTDACRPGENPARCLPGGCPPRSVHRQPAGSCHHAGSRPSR